jgi:hypothetical protein
MLHTSHPRILRFYHDHPELDFEEMNLTLVHFLEKTVLNTLKPTPTSDSLLANLQSNLLEHVTSQSAQMNVIRQSLHTLQISLTSIESSWTTLKQDYLNELRIIVNNNARDSLTDLLDQANQQWYDKINRLIAHIETKTPFSDFLPSIHDSIQSFQQTMKDETETLVQKLLSIDNNQPSDDFLNHFEQNTKQLFQGLQQPIFAYIASSEERIHSNLSNLKNLSMQTHSTQEKIAKEWGDFVQKHAAAAAATSKPDTPKSGGGIGGVGFGNEVQGGGRAGAFVAPLQRTHLHIMLSRMYPTSEVSKFATEQSGAGLLPPASRLCSNTYVLKRSDSPTILCESRNDETNVDAVDIAKFVDLIKMNNVNGILMSQNSGFNGKPNYHIECHDKHLLVFVHNMENSPDKLRPAIDIIDQLSMRIKQYTATLHKDGDEACMEWIEKDVLHAINQEYQLFISQKSAIIQNLRESQRKVISQIEEFQFPSLDKYLSSKYTAPIPKNGHRCDLCKNFNANNLKALAAHKRGCIRKMRSGSGGTDGGAGAGDTSPRLLSDSPGPYESGRRGTEGDISFTTMSSYSAASSPSPSPSPSPSSSSITRSGAVGGRSFYTDSTGGTYTYLGSGDDQDASLTQFRPVTSPIPDNFRLNHVPTHLLYPVGSDQ